MKWFKSTETNVSASRNKYATNIITSPDQYHLSRYNSSTLSRNSTCGTLYRDIFLLHIKNFTTDNNGYYWCQVVINSSFLQPSQHAWFYADDSDSCERQPFFKLAEKAQCANILYQANNVNPTQSMFISSSSYSSSSTVICNFVYHSFTKYNSIAGLYKLISALIHYWEPSWTSTCAWGGSNSSAGTVHP